MVPPVLKLRLACRYDIYQWIEPAVHAILNRPLTSITPRDAINMGYNNFYSIVLTKAKINEFRSGIAYSEPGVTQGSRCTTAEECRATWKEQWWNGLARHILYPQWVTIGQRIKAELERASIPGMCNGCLRGTIMSMKRLRYFTKDLYMIEDCVGEVKVRIGDNSPVYLPETLWSDIDDGTIDD